MNNDRFGECLFTGQKASEFNRSAVNRFTGSMKKVLILLITARQIGLMRLKNLGISERPFQTIGEAVLWHGAMQAQDFPGSLWSLALRTAGMPTQAQVRESIVAERIVRTWPMRGTLHLIHGSAAPWILPMLTPRLETANRTRFASLGFTQDVLERIRDVLTSALADGETRNRAEIYALIESTGISSGDQRGYVLISYFARAGLICFGSDLDGQPGYTLLNSWISGIEPESPADPMAHFAATYIRSHGPVTAADFARWTGVALGTARKAFGAIREHCQVEQFDGVDYWRSGADTDVFESSEPELFLLPGFDEFVLGYKDRSLFIPDPFLNHIVPGGNGVFRPTIVWDGQVVGTWSKATSKQGVAVIADWWSPTSRQQRDKFVMKSDEYARFLALPLI